VTVALVKGHSGKLAGGSFTIAAGQTRTLKLSFLPARITLLRSHHGRLTATLTVTVHPPRGNRAHDDRARHDSRLVPRPTVLIAA
jgi:hypothetical protein